MRTPRPPSPRQQLFLIQRQQATEAHALHDYVEEVVEERNRKDRLRWEKEREA